jgi:tetratricopeptide (TPR) repeat protein
VKARDFRFFIPLLLIAGGCRAGSDQSNQAAPAATGHALRPVSLPDLTSASATAQSQVRERYAALQARIDDTTTRPHELAAEYGEMGKLLIAAEFLENAEPCLLNARDLEPGEMRWPYYMGHLQRLRNAPDNAAKWFERVLALMPDHVPTLVWLGEMYLAQNRAVDAEPLFTKALSLQPREAAASYGLGRTALARQDYATAIKYLEGALSEAPNASRIHYPLALAYRGRGDREKAEAHLRQRGDVELSPVDPLMAELGGLLQNAAAYEVRGAEALEKRQWSEAVANLRKAIALAPNNALTRVNLGTALFLMDDAAGALEQFETAVRLSPDLPKAHFSIGVILEARGRDREAIDAFSVALKHDPNYLEARMQLADALRRNGRVEESLSHYAEVIKSSPSVSQARFGYGMALVRLGRFSQARDSMAEGMETFRDQPGFAHALARLLAAAPDDRVRDGRHALALMNDLLARQKTVALAETMAMTLAELGRFDEAVSWQREAIATAKQSGNAQSARAMAENLNLYEHRRPCRTPWPEVDPVFFPRPAK